MEVLKDEQLAQKVKQGNEQCLSILFERYKRMCSKIARSYFLMGGDFEDLLQEANIGLYKACLGYSEESSATFATFAKLCITRNVLSAIKSAKSKKHQMLNDSVSIFMHSDGTSDDPQEDAMLVIPSPQLTPDKKVEQTERLAEIKQLIIEKLSGFELDIFVLYLNGQTYKEIAKTLKLKDKSVDNALARIKNKLKFLNE